MHTRTHSRAATLALGLFLGITTLVIPAHAETPAPVDTRALTSGHPGPGGPSPLGEVTAQPAPDGGERSSLSAAGLPQYEVADLGGGHAGFAAEVNEHGAIAGTIFPEGTAAAGRHAVPAVWQGGVRTALDTGGRTSPIIHAGAIGDDGTVGGWEFDLATRTRYAVRWVRDDDGGYGPMERISEVRHSEGDGTGGEVQTINPAGVLHVTEPKQHVPTYSDLLWDDGAVTEVGGIPGQYPYAATWDLNEHRELAGSLTNGTFMEAATWSGGFPRVLPRQIPDAWLNQALALNDDGDVVVESFHPDGNEDAGEDRRVIAVGQEGRWTRLPELYGDDDRNSNLFPTDINNRGDVVGEALIGFSDRETTFAWLYRDGEMIDLNTVIPPGSGWELNAAYSINESGQITGVGTLDGVRRPFLLDPTRPLLFVPGAGASILKSYEEDPQRPRELWVGCGEDRMRLSRFPEDLPARDVRAVDATRYLDCYGVSGRDVPQLDAYGTMLDRLTSRYGYREYRVEEQVERFTTDGCDMSQRSESPNLFVFAYDWRQDNRLSAEKLADYIGCIRRFYPDTEIDVLTHSMGSLVARRHIMMNPGTTGFHKVVTVGAPWLGAPKLVNVLNTGNFAPPVASGPEVAHIVSGFPAAHQLMSGPLYHDYVGSAFAEDGWDYDGDGRAREGYDWANLEETFDRRWSRTTPAATAAQFQQYGGTDGQADWSADTSGIEYVHIYGVQSGLGTIGRTVATTTTDCSWLPPFRCTTRKVYKTQMTSGDQTVPTMSASRVTPRANLNAPDAQLVGIDAKYWFEDHTVEHTTLTRHPEALRAMIAAFQDEDAQLDRIAATADEPRSPSPYRYVTVTGAEDIVLADGRGNDDAPLGPGARVPLPGTQHLGQGGNADLLTMPAGVDHPWTVRFTGTGEPMSVESLVGTQQAPETAVHWRDLVVPTGHAAELVLTPAGVERLRVDRDGDGNLDETLPPTDEVSGADARDTTAPVVSLTTTMVDGRERYAVRAVDESDGSGVRDIYYSVDGETFQPYDVPIAAAPSATVRAFADDHAGNRSALAELAAADAAPGPETRLTLDPEPVNGWNQGTTTATLVADAGDGARISEIRYRTTGAQETELTSVASSRATVVVDTPGRTTLSYQAVADDGTEEPWQQRVLRIDAATPTGTLRSPVAGSVVGSLSQVTGTAADAESGVRTVEVTLERTADGTSWDGSGWVDQPTWLRAGGTTSWRMTDVPGTDALATGGYAVRARVTDAAGRVTTTAATTFTVDHPRPYDVTELGAPAGQDFSTSATDVDDHGTAVGGGGATAQALRWGADGVRTLPTPESTRWGALARAVSTDGSIAGGTDDMDSSAVRWDRDDHPHVLPHLPGEVRSMAHGVSPAGVVGRSGQRAVWWPHDRTAVALATPEGTQESWAWDIDASGTIVGRVMDAEGRFQAALWTDSGRQLSLLGTLGGKQSEALGINEVGQVVGWAETAEDAVRPFVVDLYDGGPMTEVYVPSTSGRAHDIGDDGTVVGEYETGDGSSVGFVARPGQAAKPMWELLPDDTAWSITRAVAVNGPGQVVGFGMNGGRGRGFLATVPHAPTAQDVVVDTDEGVAVPVRLVGSDVDPGTRLTWTVEDGPGHGSLGGITGDEVVYTPEPGFDGTDTFTVRADDGGLRSGLATVTVRVRPGVDTNQRPVAVVTAPATAPEGGVVTLDGSASTDADGRLTAYDWDLDADGDYDDASGATAELAVPREGLRTVSLRVTDNGGATGSAGASVQVVNVAPIVTLPPTTSVAAGRPLELAGSFADPGDDSWTATVDTGDGAERLPLDGRGFRVGATFEEPGDRTVEVEVCDGTECGTATTLVTVRDQLAARIEAPDSASEGDEVTLDARGSVGLPSDAEESAYAWDLDGDGGFDDATGPSTTLMVPQDGSYAVSLQVTDGEGETDTTGHTIAVGNVLPTVTAPATDSAVVGEAWTLAGSFADPGSDSWAATVDTGSGAIELTLDGKAFTLGQTFTTAGTHPVTVSVCDDDGCGTTTVEVTVTAAATWPWQGFFAPVDDLPVVNTVKAGQAIPMKFSLGGNRGLDIFADGSPVAIRHSCDTSGGTDGIERTVTAGSSQLTYHRGSGRYQYVWKTPKAWAGQCRTFRMTLVDGSVHEAEFRFR